MKLVLARHAGFCPGVKRAMEIAEDALKEGPLVVLGPLIHNRDAIAHIERMGAVTAGDLPERGPARVLLRTHGSAPSVYSEAAHRGIAILDATCPFVRRAQEAASHLAKQGRTVVIVGDPEHPEVQALSAWAGPGAVVVRNDEEARALVLNGAAGVIAQTTIEPRMYEEVLSVLKQRSEDVVAVDTVCLATHERQSAVRELVPQVDVMLVVGGRHSANTVKLAEIAKGMNIPVHHVERADEIQDDWFTGNETVGIAAGASTPEWIIKEVIARMEDMEKRVNEEGVPPEDKDASIADQDVPKTESNVETHQAAGEEPGAIEAPEDLRVGDIIQGIVVRVSADSVLVDIGRKSEGVIPVSELSRSRRDPREIVKEGDPVTVMVKSIDDKEGEIKLSKYRADEVLAWQKLEHAMETKETIHAPCIQEVKGGLVVDVGVRGFVPASQVERGYVSDLSVYVGRELRLKVLELDKEKNRVILSQRATLEEELEAKRSETWATITEGEIRHGVVKGLTDFGAFVDVGGVDGLLHVSELSWGRVNHPSEVLKEGQEVDVMVLRVDREKGKISLGLKQTLQDPWHSVKERYPVDSVVTGRVTRLAPFGAFVELEDGVEGLVHISELADRRVEKPDEVVKPGDMVRVKVLRVRPDDRRISLSIKQAEERSAQPESNGFADNPAVDKVTLGEMFKDLFEETKK